MSSPADHAKDVPYFGIGKDFSIVFPEVNKEHGHTVITWPKDIMGQESSPVFFTVHCFSLIVVSALLLFSALRAARQVSIRPKEGRGVSAQLFETLIKFVRDDIARPNLGSHGERYIPFVMTFFFFILFSNLWGMIPLLLTQAPTGNINITAGLALTVFASFFIIGIREQGLFAFFKNLAPSGLPVPMLFLMYPIELVGPCAKAFALALRLFANIAAGHIILAALIGLSLNGAGQLNMVGAVPAYAMSVAVSLLEVFVAFLQAYVFTMLTSVFLGSFIHPDH